jgi:hypothetical protein
VQEAIEAEPDNGPHLMGRVTSSGLKNEAMKPSVKDFPMTVMRGSSESSIGWAPEDTGHPVLEETTRLTNIWNSLGQSGLR